MEIAIVVSHARQALDFYQQIFDINIQEESNQGVAFSLDGQAFLLLEEDKSQGLYAPDRDRPNSFFFRLECQDLQELWDKAKAAGAIPLQPVNPSREASFLDPFGYLWQVFEG